MGMFGWDDPKQAATYTEEGAAIEAGARLDAPAGAEEEKKVG